MPKFGLLALLISLLTLALPASANAVITCDFDATNADVITVRLNEDNDTPALSVSPTTLHVTVIAALSNITPPTCADLPEASKVKRIDVLQGGANERSNVVINATTPFGPGLGDATEGGGAQELEIYLNLFGGTDAVQLNIGNGNHNIRLGDLAGGGGGVNLNAGVETTDPDGDDLRMFGVEYIVVADGSSNNDNIIDGRGGPGFAGPFPLAMSVLGGGGDDVISAGAGDSLLDGNGGNDLIRGSRARDVLRGGAGRDTLSYDEAAGGITLDLRLSSSQNTGGAGMDQLDQSNTGTPDFEDLVGSGFADNLTASNAANTIAGGAGADVIAALDGDDDIRLDDGGGGDNADCGDGTDTATIDSLGLTPLDALTGCESSTLVDRTPPPAQPGNPANSTAASNLVAPPTFGARTLVTLRLPVKRIPARGPLKVQVANANGFEIGARLAGETVNRVSVTRKRRIKLSANAFRVAAHTSKTVKLKLPKVLQRLLRGKHKLKLRLAAKVEDPAGHSRAVRKRVSPQLKQRSR